MAWVVDRFEEGFAVLEDLDSQATSDCPRTQLPKGVKEGDMLIWDGAKYCADPEGTAKRAQMIKEKWERITKKRKK